MCAQNVSSDVNYGTCINQKCTPAEARPRMCAQKRLARGGDVKKCAQKSRGEGNVRTFAFGEVATGEVARWRGGVSSFYHYLLHRERVREAARAREREGGRGRETTRKNA